MNNFEINMSNMINNNIEKELNRETVLENNENIYIAGETIDIPEPDEPDETDNINIITDDDSACMDDSIKTYLKEISRYPVLTAEEELKYAMLYYETKDKKYKDILVTHNLKLVIKVVKAYIKYNIPILDLVQEGNIGLMHGIDLFNPTKGYRLSTYVFWWINQSIQRYICETGGPVRFPAHFKAKQVKYSMFVKKYKAENMDNEPNDDIVKEALGLTKQEIEFIKFYYQEELSLDMPVGENKEAVLGEFIPSKAYDMDETINKICLQHDISKTMETLDDREREVIEMRFGFKDGKAYTLQEVGNYFNISRERARQIEARAMRKLSNPVRKKILKPYIEN